MLALRQLAESQSDESHLAKHQLSNTIMEMPVDWNVIWPSSILPT
jgi:hypothetical protein